MVAQEISVLLFQFAYIQLLPFYFQYGFRVRFSSLAKKVKITDTTDECILHSTSDNSSLVSLSSVKSWKTFLNAVTKRKHGRLLEIAKSVTEEDYPVLKYHRQCRSIFTMKSKLTSITAEQNAILPDQPSVSFSVRLRENHYTKIRQNQFYQSSAFFVKKELTGSRTREELVQCVELRSNDTIKASAISKNDSRIVGLAETICFVSAEAKYHFSCYRLCTRIDSSAKSSEIAETTLEEQEFQKYASVE
ncbi:unnamed protein product [Ceutorhynchus assimilis]|uniref:Uncharacterized protein n=1 Tax=Ceutorhynchus assimilis TaxID=467358 RepID=A0A9N9QE52_9CUCU|nr:unnamed protein product [Ceutorhynchus assimilis]